MGPWWCLGYFTVRLAWCLGYFRLCCGSLPQGWKGEKVSPMP